MANRDDDTRPPMNSSHLEEINRRTEQQTIHERESGQKAGTARASAKTISEIMETNEALGLGESPILQSQLGKHRKDIRVHGSRARDARSRRIARGQSEALSAVTRELSSQSVNGQIRDLGQDYRIHQQSMGMMNESDEVIQERIDALRASTQQRQRAAQELISSGKYYDQAGRVTKTGREAMESIYKEQHQDILSQATLEKTQSLRRKLGLDESSRDIARGGRVNDIEKSAFKDAVLSGEAKIGGQSAISMSSSQLEQEKAEASKKMIEVWKEMTDGVEKSKEAMAGLRKEFDQLNETVKIADEALNQSQDKRQGNISTALQIGQLVQQGWNAYKQGFREDIRGSEGANINMAMAAKQNAIGGAQLSNRMWDLRQGAISGDMTALLSLTGGIKDTMNMEGANFGALQKDIVNQKIEATNKDLSFGAMAGKIALGAGAGAASGAAIGAVGAGVMSIPGAVVGGAIGGIGAGISAYSDYKTAINDKRILEANKAYGVDTNSTNLQAQNQALALDLEQRYVTGAMTQKLYDYGQGMRQAGLAVGGRGGDKLINEFAADKGTRGGLLSRLESARIAPEEFARMAAQAGTQQGSVFDSNQIFMARNLEKAGYGTMQENMQRTSMLGAAGANNPQAGFGSVLEAAFTKGLDSSKAINMMVENTAAMVQTSAGAAIGMDTTKAAAGLVSSLVDPNMQNKEAALRSAISTEQMLNEQRSSIGANFTDMVGLAQISRASGLGSRGAMTLKKLDDQTADTLRDQLETYQKMTPNEKSSAAGQAAQSQLRDALYRKGLGEAVDSSGNIRDPGQLIAGLKERSLSFLNQGAFLGTNLPGTKGFDELRSGKLSYEQLTEPNSQYKELADKLSSASALGNLDMKQVVAAIAQGNDPNKAISKEGQDKAKAGEAGVTTQERKKLDDQATAQAAEFATQAREAARQMGGVSTAMGTIANKMTELVKQLNDSTSESMQKAAADASVQFSRGAETFSRAVDKFAGTQGMQSSPIMSPPEKPPLNKSGPKR